MKITLPRRNEILLLKIDRHWPDKMEFSSKTNNLSFFLFFSISLLFFASLYSEKISAGKGRKTNEKRKRAGIRTQYCFICRRGNADHHNCVAVSRNRKIIRQLALVLIWCLTRSMSTQIFSLNKTCSQSRLFYLFIFYLRATPWCYLDLTGPRVHWQPHTRCINKGKKLNTKPWKANLNIMLMTQRPIEFIVKFGI